MGNSYYFFRLCCARGFESEPIYLLFLVDNRCRIPAPAAWTGHIYIEDSVFVAIVTMQRVCPRLATTNMVFPIHPCGEGSNSDGASPEFGHSDPFVRVKVMFQVEPVQQMLSRFRLC